MTDEYTGHEADPPRRKERKDIESEEWRKKPVEKYMEDVKKRNNVQVTVDRIERFIEIFEEHLQENIDLDGMGIREVCQQDVELFITEVLDPDPDKSDKREERILERLKELYEMLQDNDAIGDNPVKKPLADFRNDDSRELDSPDRPYIPFNRMKEYVNWIRRPFERAFVVTGLKFGIRSSEAINIDLRCLNIAHPVFEKIVDEHDVTLDPRVRNKPDSLVIYECFTEGTEIPNEQTPGVEDKGEVRDAAAGNKRQEEGGSVLPVDSELKTALVEWLLVRTPTFDKDIHPLFVIGAAKPRRIAYNTVKGKIWFGKSSTDTNSIRVFGQEHSLNNCPECDGPVEGENLKYADKTGRRYHCNQCKETHWRPITWKKGDSTEQKVTYHQFRHYFGDAHRVGKSEIHEGEIPDFIRKKRIRGDSTDDEDTDDSVYSDKQYQDWEKDVRQPYLDAIYKFDLYDEVIPAVGEGWNE